MNPKEPKITIIPEKSWDMDCSMPSQAVSASLSQSAAYISPRLCEYYMAYGQPCELEKSSPCALKR